MSETLPQPLVVPATMRAVVLHDFGDPDVLTMEDVATPAPAAGEVLVRVRAVEVSRTRDAGTRSGRHPFSQLVHLPHVLGGDCAGMVVDVGEGVSRALVGRAVAVANHHVCGLCRPCLSGADNECERLQMLGIHRWGSYAEYVAAPVDGVHELPDGLDLGEAAALAATGPIALTQLRRGGVGPESTIVVTGMTGALATVLASLGRRLGARVIGLSRRPTEVHDDLVDELIDVSASGLARNGLTIAEGILAANHGRRPEVVIDNVCAPDVFAGYFPTLANGGRIVISGAIGYPELPVLPVPARELYSRSISLVGIRSHTIAVTDEFWSLVRDGYRLPAGVVHELPLDQAAAAHRAIADGTSSGHTVLCAP